MTRQRGAALMIMLMVAGMVGAMFAIQLTGRGASERAQVAATRLALNQANDALIGFALVNGRLPRPATNATNGLERAACATEAQCNGLIPWVTLGVNKLDGSSHVIRYSVTRAFANAPFTTTTVPTKRVQTRNALGALTYVNAKGSLAPCAATTLSATDVATDCAPAVLFSTGALNFGTTDAGAVGGNSSGPPVTNVDEITNNTAATLTFVQRAPTATTTAPGGEFDDVLTWLSGNILINRMQNAGVL